MAWCHGLALGFTPPSYRYWFGFWGLAEKLGVDRAETRLACYANTLQISQWLGFSNTTNRQLLPQETNNGHRVVLLSWHCFGIVSCLQMGISFPLSS
jgi:hypothetical protein